MASLLLRKRRNNSNNNSNDGNNIEFNHIMSPHGKAELSSSNCENHNTEQAPFSSSVIAPDMEEISETDSKSTDPPSLLADYELPQDQPPDRQQSSCRRSNSEPDMPQERRLSNQSAPPHPGSNSVNSSGKNKNTNNQRRRVPSDPPGDPPGHTPGTRGSRIMNRRYYNREDSGEPSSLISAPPDLGTVPEVASVTSSTTTPASTTPASTPSQNNNKINNSHRNSRKHRHDNHEYHQHHRHHRSDDDVNYLKSSQNSFSIDDIDDTQVPTRAGAYWVTRTREEGEVTYLVVVPENCKPGEDFPVRAGRQRLEVTCPVDCGPGQEVEISVPHDWVYHYQKRKIAVLTASPNYQNAVDATTVTAASLNSTTTGQVTGGAIPMLPEIERINQEALATGGRARTYIVTIPDNINSGEAFAVYRDGRKYKIRCPAYCHPGQRIRIAPPVQDVIEEETPDMQTFVVRVPPGVGPEGTFAFPVGRGKETQQVLVKCPKGCVSGQKIQVQLPTKAVVENIQLAYPSQKKTGWRRTVRAEDLKYQWVRLRDDSTTVTMSVFDFRKSAYVRKIFPLEANDPKLPTGHVTLVPAEQAIVDSKLKTGDGKETLFSYEDIAKQQGRPLEKKHDWFIRICKKLTLSTIRDDPDRSYIKIFISRDKLLYDSMRAIVSLSPEDMRRKWKMGFLNEPAVDESGLTKEWFQLVTEQIFHPDIGLFVPSSNNQAAVDINPASGVSCPEYHLLYFRFLGRVLGRALFDRQLIRGHLVRILYKYLLGWPITTEDIRAMDESYYNGLMNLTSLHDVSVVGLNFTVAEEHYGIHVQQELVKGGESKEVTNATLNEYLEANIRYRMFERYVPQLTELLLGFYDVIPEPALTIFDASELELILCGLPKIDLNDWQANTLYRGLYERHGRSSQAVQWFWEVVQEDYDTEMRARLLQFVTGTSGVPPSGFASLKGNDGELKKFTIHGVPPEQCLYPKAHTCFNRIDLPNYKSKAELKERLTVSITTSYVGFDAE